MVISLKESQSRRGNGVGVGRSHGVVNQCEVGDKTGEEITRLWVNDYDFVFLEAMKNHFKSSII